MERRKVYNLLRRETARLRRDNINRYPGFVAADIKKCVITPVPAIFLGLDVTGQNRK